MLSASYHARDTQIVGLVKKNASAYHFVFDNRQTLSYSRDIETRPTGAHHMIIVSTAQEARTYILEGVEHSSMQEMLDCVAGWNNTTDNQIDEWGDVWVANPQIGHWLSDNQLVEFVNSLQ